MLNYIIDVFKKKFPSEEDILRDLLISILRKHKINEVTIAIIANQINNSKSKSNISDILKNNKIDDIIYQELILEHTRREKN